MAEFEAAGWPMERTCRRAASLRQEAYRGDSSWWWFDCLPGDRADNDVPAVERVRLDGYRRLIQPGDDFLVDFSFIGANGWFGTKPGDFTTIFELHAYRGYGHGPFRLAVDHHSNDQITLDVFAENKVAQVGRFAINSRYDVQVARTKGTLRVTTFGREVLVVDNFAQGVPPLYPQFGIYRDHRNTRQNMRLRVNKLTTNNPLA